MESQDERSIVALPMVPVPDQVVFPGLITPLIVGRQKSLRALEEALNRDQTLFLVAQKSPLILEPTEKDLYEVGTIVETMQTMRLPDGNVRLLVEGKARARIVQFVQDEPYFLVQVEVIDESEQTDPSTSSGQSLEAEAWMRNARQQFERAIHLSKTIPPEAIVGASNIDLPGRLADFIAYYLELKVAEKQQILETFDAKERLQHVLKLLARELRILEIDKDIESRVREGVGESQKEFILRERLKAIQEELGERDSFVAEVEELRQKVEAAKMPEQAKERALKEIDRLEKIPPMAPETGVIRTYVDWLVSLPWSKRTKDNIDIDKAWQILEEDHYGLKDVKERVLEFLAVRKLTDKTKGPILCFIGPPGVGKTSIGKSIARAMGRKFVRISLGGVRDEAEIRGHRRTYVGALPGRIIQTMRTAGVKNPVFMMDEIDKIGIDFRGDPAAALLEALDPEQNDSFSDHYIEIPFDLSEVLFILTGNVIDTVPPALKDRMEILNFPGYIEDEKVNIAKYFLIPKGLEHHGLKREHVSINESALRHIVRHYTQEAGVRNLERSLASIFRKIAVKVAKGQKGKMKVTPRNLHSLLGPPKFHLTKAEEQNEVAVATALAWTEVGGDILNVEVSLNDGTGKLTLTGHLGQVMQESAQAAVSYTRSVAKQLSIEGKFFEKTDIHIHVPTGAVPKDGPSAGVSMAVALISALSQIPVRKDVGMTGEITLRGKILPVGGIREKVLAAHRAELKHVVMPKDNEKDLHDLPANVMRDITFHFCTHMEEALEVALTQKLPALKAPPKAAAVEQVVA